MLHTKTAYYKFMTSIDKSNEVPRLINLLIEFEEKVEGHLNKKYKPFLRSIVNICKN